MKSEVVQLVFALLTLVLGGAAEELLPKCAGVGFPVLMSAVAYFAVRRPLPHATLFALAAGGVEDALGGLPPFTSASFFLGMTALARQPPVPAPALVLAFPLYQLWLRVWVADLGGGVFGRMLIALPVGALTLYAVGLLLGWARRKAAVGD